MKPYLYETHLHTSPVSRCGRGDVEENLLYYKEQGYDGVFITNHFIDGNMHREPDMTYSEMLDFYFSDYHKAVEFGKKIGIKVFLGIESSTHGPDFTIFGLPESFYYEHPEFVELTAKGKIQLCREHGAVVIQAHPFREAGYIDHISLFPRDVDGVEVINAGNRGVADKMAEYYSKEYGLRPFAGTDNHMAGYNPRYAGIMTDVPIESVEHFIELFRHGDYEIFEREGYIPEI